MSDKTKRILVMTLGGLLFSLTLEKYGVWNKIVKML
jgi:hypothetical protein